MCPAKEGRGGKKAKRGRVRERDGGVGRNKRIGRREEGSEGGKEITKRGLATKESCQRITVELSTNQDLQNSPLENFPLLNR